MKRFQNITHANFSSLCRGAADIIHQWPLTKEKPDTGTAKRRPSRIESESIMIRTESNYNHINAC